VNADDAVLDGRDVKLDEGGRPIFLDLCAVAGLSVSSPLICWL
jgi:hypothetical protein